MCTDSATSMGWRGEGRGLETGMRLLVYSGCNVTVVAWHCDVTTCRASSRGLFLFWGAITGNIVDNGYWGATAFSLLLSSMHSHGGGHQCATRRLVSGVCLGADRCIIILIFAIVIACLLTTPLKTENHYSIAGMIYDVANELTLSIVTWVLPSRAPQPTFAHLIDTRGEHKDTYVIFYLNTFNLVRSRKSRKDFFQT